MHKKILLVSSDEDFADRLSRRISTHDYEVEIVTTGKAALEKALESPSLILLDMGLTDISGHDVCQKLRENKETNHIPMIMLTAEKVFYENIKGLYIGADDVLKKPFELDELLARMEAVLRRTRPFEERERFKRQASTEIRQIVREGLIIPHFQPIYYFKPKRLLGLEVLSRAAVKGSSFQNSETLFDAAFRVGLLMDLEIACHSKALSVLDEYLKKNQVFFNVNPYVVQDPRFDDLVSSYKKYTTPDKITLELTERMGISDFAIFSKKIEDVKKEGFKISLDDIGSGYASLNSIIEVRPDFVKIDMHLVRDIHKDPVRQNLVKAIISFCKSSSIVSIAEGIEQKEELDLLVKCGVDAGQGYFLGRPNSEILKTEEEIKRELARK